MRDVLNCCEKHTLMSIPTACLPNDVAVGLLSSLSGGVLELRLVKLTHGQIDGCVSITMPIFDSYMELVNQS